MMTASIKEREERLFDTWRQRDGMAGFSPDGIVDEDAYLASPVKILYVLKEVNDETQTGFNLVNFLRDGGRGQTWNNIVRWTEGVHHLKMEGAKPSWSDIAGVSEEMRKDVLSKIAVMNLKKVPGLGSSNWQEVHDAAKSHSDLLKQQLFLYNADVVICCGTFGYLNDCVFDKTFVERSTHQGIGYACLGQERPQFLIDYFHPAARYPANMLLYPLLHAVSEILDIST